MREFSARDRAEMTRLVNELLGMNYKIEEDGRPCRYVGCGQMKRDCLGDEELVRIVEKELDSQGKWIDEIAESYKKVMAGW